MGVFGKRKNDNGHSNRDKLRDFLRNQDVDDAEILSEESFSKGKARQSFDDAALALDKRVLLIASLIAGLLAGFCYAHFFNAPAGGSSSSFDAASLTRNVQIGKAERVRYLSKILHNDVDVYDMPSDVSGTVIAKLNRNMKVEYLDLVPSLDIKENVGVTCFDIKISRLFGKSFVIPKGTEVNLVGYNSATGEYDANVSIDGKIRSITVNSHEIKRPYIRGWVKVRTEHGQEGYVYGDAVSVKALK